MTIAPKKAKIYHAAEEIFPIDFPSISHGRKSMERQQDKFTTCSFEPYEVRSKDGETTVKKWRAVFPYKDENGKWRKKSVTLKTTGRDKGRSKQVQKAIEAEAEALRVQLNREVKQAEIEALEAPKRQTLSTYLAGYIEERAISVEPSTVDGYRHLANNVIGAFIGDMELQEMQPDVIARWMREAMGEYAAASVRKAFVLLRAALGQACDRDLIPKDPTRGLKAPKQAAPVSNSLTEADRGAVLAYVNIKPTLPTSVAIRMALYTGMRRGEMCALRWKNVDLEALTLRVAESFGKASKKDVADSIVNPLCFSGFYLKEPKNKSSIRTVYFPEDLAKALRARKALMKAQCLEAGISFSENMYVLGDIKDYETTRGGNAARDYVPMHPHTLWVKWHSIAEDLELVGTEGKIPALHDLRHTFATTAIASGVDVKTVSSSMGHTDTAMTLNRYTSADPDAQRRAADKMGEVYGACLEEAQSVAEILELGKTGTDE